MNRDKLNIRYFINWFFGRKMLPYWAVLIADSLIVFVSAFFTFWATNRTLITFEQRYSVLYSSLLFVFLSWIGARCFKTYAGVLRYSSTIDLLKLAYANTLSLILALVSVALFKQLGVQPLSAFTLL